MGGVGGEPICSKVCQTELQLSTNASDEKHQSMAGNLMNFFKCSNVYFWLSQVKISNLFSNDFVKNKVDVILITSNNSTMYVWTSK